MVGELCSDWDLEEAFLDLSKGGPFQESSTRVKDEADFLGAMLLMGNTDEDSFNGIHRQRSETWIVFKVRSEP